jgi:hypothetical protein
MARRMQQPKEYYWQGKGGEGVTLEKIIFELLGRDFDENFADPVSVDMTDVYTLQFDFYNDDTAVEGHSIIHVSHKENRHINFNMVLLRWDNDSTNMATNIDSVTTIDDSLISGIENFEFAVYLRKIASNQLHRRDYS